METAADLAIGLDVRQSRSYKKYMEGIGWNVEEVEGMQFFVRKIGPVAVAKIQRVGLMLPWEKIKQLLKKYRVMMCKLEPDHTATVEQLTEIKRLGFKQDSSPMLGSKTMFVDLRPTEKEMMEALGSDTRYKLRKLQKTDHNIDLNDHDSFYAIFKKAFALKHIWMPPRDQYNALVGGFDKNCFTMTMNGTCGCLVLMNGKLASYFYGATLPEGKEHNTPYLLIWEAMKEAKRRGAVVWDFEGIYDPRWPNKGWKGFSYFKERFRGQIVDFPGSFVRWSLRDMLGI